ncbi:elongation factor 1-beta [Candidatus Pacearchaeota archaeon]|nr:elongation factor 1-beta [Candidatus Pacearchaeota archaeon]
MAFALIRVKIMPDSPSADLEKIERKTNEILTEAGSKSIKFEREPIAFGLTAVIAQFSWDDSEDSDELMGKIQSMHNISSAEIIDYRRAIG